MNEATFSSRVPGTAGQPRHALVARALLQQIISNRYPVGSLLPTEAELCKQFGVSRTTQREAVRWLRDQGMVSTRAGVGTIVLAKQPSARYIHGIQSIDDVFQYTANSQNPVVLSTRELDLGPADAELLRSPVGQRWLRIDLTRTFTGDKTPTLYSQVYLPHTYAEIAKLVPTRPSPIYSLVESEYGERVLGVDQEFKSVRIDAKAARSLQVKAGMPGLCVIRHYFGSGERLLLVTVSLYRSDRYSYKMRLRFNPKTE